MSTLTDRIARVVDDHWPLDGGNHCDCGWSGFDADIGHAAHVAEQIEAELDLTEEWSNRGAPGIWLSREGAERYARYHGETLKHRWVSAWSEVAR